MPELLPEAEPFAPEQAALLLERARAAPSIHNTQPWRFAVRADRVEVRADPGRALPAVDPDGRQRLISCGAAVFNLRLTIAHLGWEPDTTLCPDPADPDHVATVARGAPRAASGEERTLYTVIRQRRTNRDAYRPQPVPDPVQHRLMLAAERESATLCPVRPAVQRAAVASLVVRGIEQHAASPAIRAEFEHWLSHEFEPVAGTRFESWLQAPYPVPALTGRDRLAPGEPEMIHQLLAGSTLFVLCTDRDDAVHRLRAGQALQRVLLTATAAGVAVSFLNQPIEVAQLRGRLAAVLGTPGLPHMLIRAGYPRTTALPTGRRPLA
jgi:hypothetical protein